MSDAPVQQLGRYRILKELGRGAMGVVYKAEDPLLNRTVAIKTILLAADAVERGEYEARFYQEAKAAGGLNHRNIITIYDIGREGDVAFMAMELIDGIELRELMRQRRPALPLALDIAAQVADGLAAAHRQGVVHRDIKPANIMIVGGQQAKIMDFGIARVRMPDVKTQTGMLLGSPKYMSPEQVTGLAIDHRSDIFSLGVVLYEMATGTSPFANAADVAQLTYQITRTKQRAPSEIHPSFPTMFDLITARALEKDPNARYQDANDLAADLRACLTEIGSAPAIGAQIESNRTGATAAVLPADDEATLRFEDAATARIAGAPAERLDEAPTARIDRTQATGFLDVGGSTKTTKPGNLGRTDDSMQRLSVSRRFDSSEALKRLAALAAGEPANETQESAAVRSPLAESFAQGRGNAPGFRFGARHWVVAAALLAACAAAVLIAMY